MKMNKAYLLFLLLVVGNIQAQTFLHPGIDMTAQDLNYMKKQVLAGEEPWSGAFKRLQEKTRTDMDIVPVTHIIRGAYGHPDIGASALLNNSNTAYDCALIWYITGAEDLTINNCNISDNGSAIVPGPRLQHNLLLRHVSGARIRNSRFDTSISGCGIALDNCFDISIEGCEIARNAWFGVLMSTTDNVKATGNLIEGNSNSGIMAEFQYSGCRNITINDNQIQYNNGYGIEAYGAEKISSKGNEYHLNGQSMQQENISAKQQTLLK